MRRSLLLAAVLCTALAPSAASAGLVLGGRLGVALPGGDEVAGRKLADVTDWVVPLQVDLGYRFTKVAVGGYFRIGPGKLDAARAAACDGVRVTCRVTDIAFGAQLDVRLGEGKAGPWLGGYLGLDTLRWRQVVLGSASTLDVTGLELGAQGGIDFAWGVLTLGPWGAIGAGRYMWGTFESGGVKSTGDIPSSDQRTHTWIQVGIRAGFAF